MVGVGVMTFRSASHQTGRPARGAALAQLRPEQRARIIEELGIDEILILPFTAGSLS